MKYIRNKRFCIKASAYALLLTFLFIMTGCGRVDASKDIVILYTNDVHCAVDDNIGYAGLAAYKKDMEEKTPYVTLVDCGDAIQGKPVGMISQGEYPMMIMERAGYDFAIFGNHEFDYGIKRLAELVQNSDVQYLDCNIRYSGSEENALEMVEPYHIVSYGDTNVAFIGVCTPENITSSTPAFFMDESGRFVYDFYGAEDGTELYGKVQETVDECLEKGADYIILLSHLGDDESSAPFRSLDLIQNTTGVDVVLDGHAHSVIPCQIVKNKDGGETLLSSTGTELNYVGQLVITPDGMITSGLISGYSEKDEEMQRYIEEIQSRFEDDLNQVMAHSDITLGISSKDGVRIVRTRETGIGNLCADAYRMVSGADIAFVNGGGIRADLPAGDITYGDLLAVYPYGNTLCVAEVSGQEILDALEMANRFVLSQISDNGNAVGENGGFLQVSGLMFSVDTSVTSSVVTDENGMFVSCGNVRRVKDVKVLQKDGSYVPLVPNQTYTLASHDYMLKEGGDGFAMFMEDLLTLDEGMSDYQALTAYIRNYLGGTIGSEYGSPQGRIVIE
ncbi:MAG: bifunctional metallophosphatase/5'-nucleotidase [Bacillus sp. (in: Bacteria)]|nr:bifunctional metallophosphatase/5'-nucleotidase [Bacillus sp. (in: firmicutes)]MCM1426652.1 bifunctional metallophosphatase/5'-nucleotidase [Eubacterium sp.]